MEKRTVDKKLKLNMVQEVQKRPTLQLLSSLVERMNLANRLGSQYGGDRDVYEALGYPDTIEYKDYFVRYLRQDIAKAIIDRPVKASWKGDITVLENMRNKETAFEKEIKRMFLDLKLKSVFIRADKLAGIGQYSILLLGVNDGADLMTPINKKRKGLKLLYVKPLSEESAKIDKFISNPKNERYGKPEYYTVNITMPKDLGQSQQTLRVHYSRVVHLVEDLKEDEVYGTPRLEAVYNRLMDLEKVVGGDAEMFWRGARPGYQGIVDKDYEMSTTTFDGLQDQLDELENNLRRYFVNEGIELKALEQQIADPTQHVEVQIQMISAVTGIPKRILIGSERGELSSAQDKQEWISYVTSRREEQNEPMILRPFIDKCIEYNILPKPKDGYKVIWDKLFSLSDTDKVNIGKNRAIALKEYTMNPWAQEVMPIELFFEYLLGMDSLQVERILEAIKSGENELVISPEEMAQLQSKYRVTEPSTKKEGEEKEFKGRGTS